MDNSASRGRPNVYRTLCVCVCVCVCVQERERERAQGSTNLGHAVGAQRLSDTHGSGRQGDEREKERESVPTDVPIHPLAHTVTHS